MSNPETWWYMSFVDPNRPKGQRFIGCCFVKGADFPSAHIRSHQLQINPGGEVQASMYEEKDLPDTEWLEVLIPNVEKFQEMESHLIAKSRAAAKA